MSGADTFLSRWSRRKRQAEPDPAAQPPAEAESATPPEPAPPAEPVLSDEDLAALPRIEDLTPNTDIRAFLRPGVPAALKNAAMRRMWLLTPAIRDYRDPAVDYAWDWNTPGGVPGDGCAPSADSAARMLRDLVEPRQPRPAAPVPEAADTPGDAPAPAEPAAPAEALAQDAPPEPPAPPSSEPRDIAGQISPAAAARRRHGGALPS
jgi:hypothetical protein